MNNELQNVLASEYDIQVYREELSGLNCLGGDIDV